MKQICKEGEALYKQFAAFFFSVSFAVMMIAFPAVSVAAVSDALRLWALTVMPSLLPFFICSNFMFETGFTDRLAAAGEPAVRKLFRASGVCGFPFVMSMVSGYPVGVKILSDARLSGRISKEDAEKGITFCSTSGPLFMIGAVGAGMMASETAGWIIAVSHYLGAAANGIMFGRILGKSKEIPSSCPVRLNRPGTAEINYNAAAGKSITDAVSTLFLIGGYMAVFMMVIYYIKMTGYDTPPWFPGILELSVGCRETAEFVYYTQMQKTVICSAMISFGGACVLFQSMSFIGRTDISIKLFLVSKVCHSAFAALFAFILAKAVYTVHPVSLNVFSFVSGYAEPWMGKSGFIYNLLFSGGAVCILALVFIMTVIIWSARTEMNKILEKKKGRRE